MRLIFGLTILILIAVSLFADYKWKRWIAARKQERDFPAEAGFDSREREK